MQAGLTPLQLWQQWVSKSLTKMIIIDVPSWPSISCDIDKPLKLKVHVSFHQYTNAAEIISLIGTVVD